MVDKNNTSKKLLPQKTMVKKIGGQIGHVAGEIVLGKEHLVEVAGHAIDSIKETIHNITTRKKSATKKTARSATKTSTVKSNAKRLNKQKTKTIVAKKVSPAKKTSRKAAKKK